MQRGHLLKAQQNSLQVHHRHKNSVVQNIAELQPVNHEAQRFVTASKRHRTTRAAENGRPAPHVTEVDKKQMSRAPRPETNSTMNITSSHASAVHQPLILQPSASVRKHVSSSSYKDEHFGRRVTPAVHSAGSVTLDAANPVTDGTRTSLNAAVVKNSSQEHTHKVDYNSSVSHSSKVNDFSGNNRPVNSLATESALLPVYVPLRTIAVTNTSNPVHNSLAWSQHYFERLDDLPVFETSVTNATTSGPSEETCNSSSVPLTKPSLVFASKSVIATTYLSRRPPIFSPVHVVTPSDSDSGPSLTSNDVDRSSAQSDSSSATDDSAQSAASLPARLTDGKRNACARPSMMAVTSPEVPPRLSSNKGQSMSRLSSWKLHKALFTNPPDSQSALLSDECNNGGIFSTANSTKNVCAGPAPTDAVLMPDSLPAFVIRPSAFVPFTTSSATHISSVVSSVCSPRVPSHGSVSPLLPLSDFSVSSVDIVAEKSLPETTHSSVVMSDPVPQVLALDITGRFPAKLSSSAVSSYADTFLSTAAANVSTSSKSTKALQPDWLGQQPSTKLLTSIPPTLTVPSARYTMPCALTISTHIPVPSPNIDTVTSSLQTALPSVISDTVVIAASSACDPSWFCSTTAAGDMLSSSVPSTFSLSQAIESSCKLSETVLGELHTSHPTLQDEPNAPQLYTSTPPITGCRLSSDGVRVSSSQSHASNDSLEHIDVPAAAIEKTAEDCSMDKQKSVDVVATEFSEVEADDDASSDIVPLEGEPDPVPVVQPLFFKRKQSSGSKTLQRVSFSPLALLLDASLEGDLELVMNTVKKVSCFFADFCLLLSVFIVNCY